ncbi:MAG: phage major capsid protein [Solirubrobacteraceae bacterium]|nr:phage major capsid protein [Solirubrobacteraceae bacterium]
MPALGVNSTHGQDSWSTTLIEALSLESAVLRAGARRIVAEGRIVHVPRILVAPAADWVAEGADLPSDAGSADQLVLTPKKLGNVIALSNESIEDAPINELDAVGRSMVRGVATKLDARFFSNSAVSSVAPAGLLNTTAYSLPSATGSGITITRIFGAIGAIAAVGGVADTVFISAADRTAVQLETLTSGYKLTTDPTQPGVEYIGGARLIVAPLTAGTAVVCQADYIALAVRRDASVQFSDQNAFTSDETVARVTMRVDYAPSDLNAFYVLKPA